MGIGNTVFYINVSELKMIIEQLNKIIFEIRLLEEQFKLPPYRIDNELTACALDHKARAHENLARTLYAIVSEYALNEI